MSVRMVTIDDVRAAETPDPRSCLAGTADPFLCPGALLGLPASRRVWLKDYGWTPSGSFKLLGALNWMANNLERIGDRPVAAHSSGNFASGIAFAGMRFGKRVIVVMPETAPRVKFERTRSFGAEIRTYDIARDHETGERDRLTREIADGEGAIQASPYDDPHVIAGNGVGALEIVRDLQREGRRVSQFFCPVSGGGLMAGQAIAIADGFPQARIIGVEPAGADDFRQSLAAGSRVRIERPDQHLRRAALVRRRGTQLADLEAPRESGGCDSRRGHATRRCGGCMRSMDYEPSPPARSPSRPWSAARSDLTGDGDIVVVISGRNVDDDAFRTWI